MKASDLKKPQGVTPREHHENQNTFREDRINENLCKQRVALEAIVPLMETLVKQNANGIEAIQKLSDRVAEMMAHNETLLEAANKNTDRIVEATKK